MKRRSGQFGTLALFSLLLATTGIKAGENAVKKLPNPKVPVKAPAPLNVPKTCDEKCDLMSKRDKVSYAIGVDIGNDILRNVNPEKLDLEVKNIIKGFADTLNQRQLHLTKAERELIVELFFNELKAKEIETTRKCAAANKQAGETFLANNQKKPGVITLPSGVQYKILKPGTGKKPQKDSLISVQYRGTFIDGKVFGQTTPNAPVALNMAGPDRHPIDGWLDVLPLMAEGAKWTVYIPAEKAYGKTGHSIIPPHSTLVFEIELVKVSPPKSGKKTLVQKLSKINVSPSGAKEK